MLDSAGKKAKIVDDYSEMEIVSDKPVLSTTLFVFFIAQYIRLARGIDIENAKYPLKNAEITCEYQYGISNEVLPGKLAQVSFKRGQTLLIKVKCE